MDQTTNNLQAYWTLVVCFGFTSCGLSLRLATRWTDNSTRLQNTSNIYVTHNCLRADVTSVLHLKSAWHWDLIFEKKECTVIFSIGQNKFVHDWLFLLAEFERGGTGGEVGWDSCRARAKAIGKQRKAQINRTALMSTVRSDCFSWWDSGTGRSTVNDRSYLGLCKEIKHKKHRAASAWPFY